MLEYMKPSRTVDLEHGIYLFDQQASESTASWRISCYRSSTSVQIHFSQMNLWSRGIESSDQSLLTVINDCLPFQKPISSYLATSSLIAQYKTYGAWLRACVLMICKLNANDIHEWKQPICNRIWESPPYGICTWFAQCVFLVAQVEIYQSPDFVISMLNNPSNCSRLLRRLAVSYKGEISLPFNPPRRYSCRVRGPLLREIIRIHARGLSRYS